MNFIVTRKSDGAEVIRYSAGGVVEGEWPLADFDHTEFFPDTPTPVQVQTRLSKQEFFDRLGGAAVGFILTAAKVDVSVEAWVKRLDLVTPDADGTSVDLTDPRTVQGVNDLGELLIANGVVDSAWASGVLNG